MRLALSHEFAVSADAAAARAFFRRTEDVAGCIPGVSVVGRRDDGRYDAVIVVAVGPMKVRFSGTVDVTIEDDVVNLNARGADASGQTRAATDATLVVRSAGQPAGQMSVISISGHVEFLGPLAGVARTGGAVVASRLLKAFGERLSCAVEAEGSARAGS